MIRRLNWYAVSAIFFVFAMYAVLWSDVPDFYAVPLGLTAITAAVLSLRS